MGTKSAIWILPLRNPKLSEIPLNHNVLEEAELSEDLNLATKETKGAFYKLYGQLKSNNINFTEEEIKEKLSDQDL